MCVVAAVPRGRGDGGDVAPMQTCVTRLPSRPSVGVTHHTFPALRPQPPPSLPLHLFTCYRSPSYYPSAFLSPFFRHSTILSRATNPLSCQPSGLSPSLPACRLASVHHPCESHKAFAAVLSGASALPLKPWGAARRGVSQAGAVVQTRRGSAVLRVAARQSQGCSLSMTKARVGGFPVPRYCCTGAIL
jgi:hypothetical protein